MPYVLDPQKNGSVGERGGGWQRVLDANFPYDYPEGLDLKPGSDLHQKIVNEVTRRARESKTIMSRKYDEWRETDRNLKAYVAPDVKENNKKEDQMIQPEFVIPETHATLDVLLTYMSSAFLQDPIWKYEGVGPEDVLGSMLMTKVIAHQSRRNKVALGLHTMWRDAFSKGFGAVSPIWHREMGTKTVVQNEGVLDMMARMFFVDRADRRRSERQLLYEGNKLVNIDPYSFLPDPNVSIDRIQEAEFVAWVERTNLMHILNRDRDEGDMMFNGQYVKFIDGRSTITSIDGRTTRETSRRDEHISTNNPVDILWEYVDIIPEEWNLGRSKYPEPWLFALAGDKIVIAAQPLGLDHGMKPIAVAAPDYDGYSITPVSKLGLIQDLQRLIDFLYTSHIQNVRKTINDMVVVDPSLVSYYDLANPKPGKIIRLRRAAWGRNQMDQAVKQLTIQDITRGNIADANILSSLMQKGVSSPENLQGGVPQRTSRISATEIGGSRMAGLSRLEKTARIISEQAMQPIGQMFASHVQQLMSEDTYINVIGEWEERLRDDFNLPIERDRVPVSPLDLVVDYDVMANDGTIPGAEDAQTWVQLFQILTQSPEVAQGFNMPSIFKHIARQLGAKNVDQFQLRPPKVMEDGEVQREVERGNLVQADDE